jgi:hypothetical protein
MTTTVYATTCGTCGANVPTTPNGGPGGLTDPSVLPLAAPSLTTVYCGPACLEKARGAAVPITPWGG